MYVSAQTLKCPARHDCLNYPSLANTRLDSFYDRFSRAYKSAASPSTSLGLWMSGATLEANSHWGLCDARRAPAGKPGALYRGESNGQHRPAGAAPLTVTAALPARRSTVPAIGITASMRLSVADRLLATLCKPENPSHLCAATGLDASALALAAPLFQPTT